MATETRNPTPHAPSEAESLWHKAGGEAGVRRVLVALYDVLFQDRMVAFLFEGKDKAHIVEQQVCFTSAFLGGPHRYEGLPLPEAHANLPLLAGHFDRRHHVLARILVEQALPEDVCEAWLRIDEGLRGSVLKSGEGARGLARLP